MNVDEFANLLKQFAERPIPSVIGRHVYVWRKTADALSTRVPRKVLATLDLNDLCRTLERTPSTDDAARAMLTEAITARLQQEFPRDERQRVLIVSGCGLLMRYRVSLGPFMQLASENRLIVFVAPVDDSSYQPGQPLPGYIYLRPDATLSFFKNSLPGEEAFIGD
ncbi:hypothetical protein ANRL3_00855 [Anaerolineae bacterium]|nr:hypothetical protein ANRL3_00855 [Anaerolineae bacterium]